MTVLRASPTLAPRTQFDAGLLPETHLAGEQAVSNRGRHVIDVGGMSMLALAWRSPEAALRLYHGREVMATHVPEHPPDPPCLVQHPDGRADMFFSAGERLFAWEIGARATGPWPVDGAHGQLQDVVALSADNTIAAMLNQGELTLLRCRGQRVEHIARVEGTGCGAACLERDTHDRLHLVYEKDQGLMYCRYDGLDEIHRPSLVQRIAYAYAFSPVLLSLGRTLLVAYLGESCRHEGEKRWNTAWQRLGRGGYIGALLIERGDVQRFCLARSQQIVNRLRPTGEAYGGGPNDTLRVRIEEFAPPAIVQDPHGVAHVLWANRDRRWVYASRLLGRTFSEPVELFGPLEELHWTPLAARRTRAGATPNNLAIDAALLTQSRVYLDAFAVPSTAVTGERRIDFVQPDELAWLEGIEFELNALQRHPGNPVIAVGEDDSFDDAAVVADVFRENDRWVAEYRYRRRGDDLAGVGDWGVDGRAVSDDGLHWRKQVPEPLEQRYHVEGAEQHLFPLRYIEDVDEADPQRRFKGLWRSSSDEPWGWIPMVSPNAKHWARVDRTTVLRCDDDLRIWVDNRDVPQRRYKATGIGRSHGGRVCVMFTSADGVHWNGIRHTLDFHDPFGAPPDPNTTGHILLDAWSGPADEDELHGGYIFHDGERWLLHYMKWTPDGHVFCALASSRDGVHFSRVEGGKPTLGLGAPGTWDAGRVAIREAPFLVDGVFRQYYTGSGWKHGMGGMGAKTSPIGHHAPMQCGLATIEAGRWRHAQLKRHVDEGMLQTIAYTLGQPMDLHVDVDQPAPSSRALRCAVIDPDSGSAYPGFDSSQCDPIGHGRRERVTWGGRSLASLGAQCVAIRVSFNDPRMRLFSLTLVPADTQSFDP